MNMGLSQANQEGLKFLRVILVLSSFSPLFVLWAVRGIVFLQDIFFVPVCMLLATVPSSILFLREKIAKRQRDARTLTVGRAEKHSGHLLAYLFAVLLPLYSQDVCDWRDFSSLILALVIVVFLFWHLNFHHLNMLFAIRGYHVFTVHPPQQESKHANPDSYVLITRRRGLPTGEKIVGLRLTNAVYLEETDEF